MKKKILVLWWVCSFLSLIILNAVPAFAKMDLVVEYPYSLEKKNLHEVSVGSTMPLYLNIRNADNSQPENVDIEINLPEGFTPIENENWRYDVDKHMLKASFMLPADFGQTFDLIYLEPNHNLLPGSKNISINVQAKDWQEKKTISFSYLSIDNNQDTKAVKSKKTIDKTKFNWYIQSITLPVDAQGNRDDRIADGVLYVRDAALENFRNRLMGEGSTNWSSMYNHPATFVILEMRNPKKDVRLLKFKAELVDRSTGEVLPGLTAVASSNHEDGNGWAGEKDNNSGTTALLSLDGKQNQSFILPLYVDYFSILEGDYNLKVTVSGNGQEKIQETPLRIAKKHNFGLLCVGIAIACFTGTLFFSKKIYQCIEKVGAKGAVTIALFASLAFVGITLPTTLLGDFLHIFLGPFSGLITGVLTGIFQYLLIFALLSLYRKPGVLSLMLFVKYLLASLMFGHFTPIGILSTCVNTVFLEIVLYMLGFYKTDALGKRYMLFMALSMGVTDAVINIVNLQQMMFFYRLYYADWFLALYMLINGVVYSSIGTYLGFKVGGKLQQVMGE